MALPNFYINGFMCIYIYALLRLFCQLIEIYSFGNVIHAYILSAMSILNVCTMDNKQRQITIIYNNTLLLFYFDFKLTKLEAFNFIRSF